MSLYGTYIYRPTPIPPNPTYGVSDITIIIPTTDLMSITLHNVLQSILVHRVPKLIIPTGGIDAAAQIQRFKEMFPDRPVLVLHRDMASRREQTAQALEQVETSLIILQDDHTYWPESSRFVSSVLAPFENPQIGAVSADLQARHCNHPFSWAGFWNFMGMTYLFLHGYLNSYMPFTREPLNADDDKFHTRWLIEHDWDIGLQAGPDSVMMTELGEWPKLMTQVLRWTRTTWRNNPGQLMNRYTWIRHPFMSYSLLMWFFRQSLTQEFCMFYSLNGALKQLGKEKYYAASAVALGTWIVGFKLVKVLEHFRKYPGDIVYFPGYMLFGHFSALIKIYAAFTCWNISWGTAEVANAKGEARISDIKGKIDDSARTEKVGSEKELLRNRVCGKGTSPLAYLRLP
ncbi:hypothetical protein BDW02DRAFT_614055 [Decorospora gaudefroyi]|uniref:Glycosyltransferase family 2 protein n=1 Tax=Decorospora gaudefroyi TaxID=184978 RepID=A0A6A5KLP4_9PLEO|nr:hypothetical protein BDW02DRAFT_614055 [Decorospora gaudefroyi]